MTLSDRQITFGEICHRSSSFEYPVVDADEVTRYVYSNPYMDYRCKFDIYKPDYVQTTWELMQNWTEVHQTLTLEGKALWDSIG